MTVARDGAGGGGKGVGVRGDRRGCRGGRHESAQAGVLVGPGSLC